MKKNIYLGLMGCMLGFSPLTMMAQAPQNLERGGVLELNAPDGFASYQWQVSSDAKTFVNLPQQKGQKLSIKVYAPGFYRALQKDSNSKTTYSDTTHVTLTPLEYAANYSISGGAHGFIETLDGQPGAKGISAPEDREGPIAGTSKSLTDWTNGKSMVAYYLHHPQSTIDTKMFYRLKAGTSASFRITVWDPQDMSKPLSESFAAMRGTGRLDSISLVSVDVPHSDYYRYQLECLSGWNNITEIRKFHHYSPSSEQTYKNGYLSSPSVHLNNWRSTDGRAPHDADGFMTSSYDWCYMEVMMPKESDIPGTYIMSLGVLNGYMGIQMNGYQSNGEPLHDVIFSMWDDGDTDQNPNLPANLRANVLDHHPQATATRFGNEGTGMKTFLSGNHWNCDTFVQFITNCRDEVSTYKVMVNGKEETRTQNNTLVSTWFNAQDGKGWQYMSTLRLPNKSTLFNSWYSFLENYNYPTGQALRRGYYRNGYGHAKRGNRWFHFNKVNFGHTDGSDAVGARQDFGQGTTDEFEKTYFMTTGGFIPKKVTGSTVTRNRKNTPVDTINLDKLLERVDQAIAFEKNKIAEEENFKKNKLNKKDWKVVKFSSEETSGEGSNGRMAMVIDNDPATYWHSKWQGGTASYPHYVVVDMKEEHNINGVQILMSGGSDRYIKSFNFYVSDDNLRWQKVYSDNDAPDKEMFHFMLPNPVKARYFKLEITKSRCSYAPHVRINEIDVTESTETGIEQIESAQDFAVSCGKNEVYVKSPVALDNVEIAVYRADGACLHTQTLSSMPANELVRIPMLNATKGMYIVTCQSGNQKVSKQILWK